MTGRTRGADRRRRRWSRRIGAAAAVLTVASSAMIAAPNPHMPAGIGAFPTPTTSHADGVRPIDRIPATKTKEPTDDPSRATEPTDGHDREAADVTTDPSVPRPRGGSGPTPAPVAGQPPGGAGVEGGSPAGEDPGGGESAAGGEGPPVPTGDDVVDLVNAHRADVGCAPLVIDGGLDATAQGWSESMAATDDGADGDLTHSPGAGVTYGENIASGQASAAEVVQAWMDSPGHRANILDCDYRTTGTGYAPDDTGPYWTQTFGF